MSTHVLLPQTSAFRQKQRNPSVQRCTSIPFSSKRRHFHRTVINRGVLKVQCLSEDKKPVRTLVSFDVDGTLVTSVDDTASKLHKAAFTHCFKAGFGLDVDIDEVQHQGSTDPLIILAVLDKFDLDVREGMQRMPELMQIMVDYFLENAENAGDGLRLLPGVISLLKYLKERGDTATCLVTGNLEPIGWAKMRALGIYDLFSSPSFGGFGSDFCSGNFKESWKDRSQLIQIAAQKAQNVFGASIEKRFHIGDAPMDMMAANEAGVTAIGVTTGAYSKQVLMDAQAPTILASLEDLNQVLSILELNES